MFFHCYHTKLKQWGLAILNGHSDMGACSVGLHNRNIVPEVQENFLCLWEHCEVRRQSNILFLSTVDDKLHGQSNQVKYSADKYVCIQMSMDNPEWFYRHVEMHAHCLEANEENALFCGWKGKK